MILLPFRQKNCIQEHQIGDVIQLMNINGSTRYNSACRWWPKEICSEKACGSSSLRIANSLQLVVVRNRDIRHSRLQVRNGSVQRYRGRLSDCSIRYRSMETIPMNTKHPRLQKTWRCVKMSVRSDSCRSLLPLSSGHCLKKLADHNES